MILRVHGYTQNTTRLEENVPILTVNLSDDHTDALGLTLSLSLSAHCHFRTGPHSALSADSAPNAVPDVVRASTERSWRADTQRSPDDTTTTHAATDDRGTRSTRSAASIVSVFLFHILHVHV